MKKLLSTCALLAAAFGMSRSASAMTYAEGDLLLILRQDGYDNIEYNLGPVANLTGLANGAQVNVAGWDSNLALGAYGGSLAGAQFILCASAPFVAGSANNAVYVTAGTPDTAPLCVTGSKLQQLIGKIDLIGTDAAAGAGAAQNYEISAGNSASYDAIVTGGLGLDAASWSGLTAFSVQQLTPGTNNFFRINSSSLASKPAAIQVGAFVLDETGNLSFTAGSTVSLPVVTSPVLSVSYAAGAVTVSFPTQTGVTYKLRASSDLKTGKSSWAAVGSTVLGDGSVATLHDLPTIQTYYVVEAYR